MVHPNWTGEHIFIVFESVLMVVVDEGIEGLEGICLCDSVLQDHSPEDLLPLVLGVGALVHQVIIVLVSVKQAQNIGIYHHL